MTRDEAVKRQMKATGFTHIACAGFIDQMAGLGMLKLDEPKNLPQRLRDFISDTRLAQGDAMTRLEQLHDVLKDCGLKIVEAK